MEPFFAIHRTPKRQSSRETADAEIKKSDLLTLTPPLEILAGIVETRNFASKMNKTLEFDLRERPFKKFKKSAILYQSSWNTVYSDDVGMFSEIPFQEEEIASLEDGYSYVQETRHAAVSPYCFTIPEDNAQCIHTLEKEDLVKSMEIAFDEALAQQLLLGMRFVEANLNSADILLGSVWSANDPLQADPLFTNASPEVVLESMETFLYSRLSALYSYVALPVEQIAMIVSWIDRFLATVSSEAPLMKFRNSWREDCDYLLSQCLESMLNELNVCLSPSVLVEREQSICQDPAGHLGMGLSERVSLVVKQLMNFARDMLPPCYVSKSTSLCSQVLASLVSGLKQKIENDWRDISPSTYCAIVNEATWLTEQCKQQNGPYVGTQGNTLEDNDSRKYLIELFAELATHAADYLCQRIMLNVSKPKNDILTSVGDAAWLSDEDNSSSAMERAITVLQESFDQLNVYLASDEIFGAVLKDCFDRVIQMYLEAFFANTIVNGVKSAEAASEELQKDHLRLIDFFTGPTFEKYRRGTTSRYFYAPARIPEELRILQSIAAIVSPFNHPADVHEDIMAVIRRFPGNKDDKGSAAVFHLAALQKQYLGFEFVLWVKAIARAKKEIAAMEDSSEELDDEQTEDLKSCVTGGQSTAQRYMQWPNNLNL